MRNDLVIVNLEFKLFRVLIGPAKPIAQLVMASDSFVLNNGKE